MAGIRATDHWLDRLKASLRKAHFQHAAPGTPGAGGSIAEHRYTRAVVFAMTNQVTGNAMPIDPLRIISTCYRTRYKQPRQES
jgi:hypothetical protein